MILNYTYERVEIIILVNGEKYNLRKMKFGVAKLFGLACCREPEIYA